MEAAVRTCEAAGSKQVRNGVENALTERKTKATIKDSCDAMK